MTFPSISFLRHIDFFRRTRVLRLREIAVVILLSTAVVVSEAGSLTMILPILAFVEHGRDVEVFAQSSGVASSIVKTYVLVGIPVSILSLSFVAFVMVVFRQAINYLNSIEIERLKWVIARRLSLRFFGGVFGSTAANIRSYKVGEFMTAADYECNATAALARIYGTMWMHVLSFLVYGAVLAITAPIASFVAGVIILCLLKSLGFLNRITKRLSNVALQYRRRYADFLNERFRAWKLIKLGNTLAVETEKADQIQSLIVSNQIRQLRVTGVLALIFVPIMTALLLTMLYVFVEVLRLDVATVVLFILVLIRLTPVSQALQSQFILLAQFAPAKERIEAAFRAAAVHSEDVYAGRELKQVQSGIRFENVSFCYPDRDAPALSNISVTIPAFGMTALIGPSGAGKSTFVDLIPRLIEPKTGHIEIDGTPIRELSLFSLRRSISYVTQEPFLFDASIAENIRYLRPNATLDEIKRAAQLANADEFIQCTPHGYDTGLGDQGAKLSGGQKQRIVLARAFLSESPILILDEPTSALDYDSESAIQRAIEGMVESGKLTVIVIAHRLSTIRNADFVIQLKEGRIVKTGLTSEVLEGISDMSAVLEGAPH